MQHGGWTIKACASDDVQALTRELGISELTASVLVRRGYGEPDSARAFLAGGAAGHDPFLLGDMARGGRDDPRGDRGRASASASTATTTSTGSAPPRSPSDCLRALGAEVGLAPAEPLRRGLRPLRPDARPARRRGLRPRADRRLRDHGRRGGRAREGARARRRRHRSPPARRARCPTARSSRRGRPSIRSPSSAAPASSRKLARGARRPDRGAPADLIGLATIADVVPLVDENRAFALAGLRALARTQKPGLRALMQRRARRSGGRRRGRRRLPARAAHQRRRPARASARGARAAADRRRRRGEAARAAARGGEPRAAGRRGADPPLGGRADRVVAREQAAPSRLRRSPTRTGTRA